MEGERERGIVIVEFKGPLLGTGGGSRVDHPWTGSITKVTLYGAGPPSSFGRSSLRVNYCLKFRHTHTHTRLVGLTFKRVTLV